MTHARAQWPSGLKRPAATTSIEGIIQLEAATEKHAIYNVGLIIRAYSEMDFIVSHLAIRASHHPSYIGLFPRYPKEIRERIKFWTRVIDVDGPLQKYASFVTSALKSYKDVADFRHIAAHSRFYYERPGLLVFERVQPGQKGSTNLLTRHTWVKMTPRQLSHNAKLCVRSAKLFVRMYERVERLNLLPYQGSLAMAPGGDADA